MAAQIFRHLHRVSYAECTLGNHVYYARYLELLETARGEMFRHLGTPLGRWQEQDTLFPVIECRLRYKAPARYDDLLTVEVWLTELERVRMTFGYRLWSPSATEILQAATCHACTSVAEKVKRLPEELRQQLQPYLHGPESLVF